MTNKPQHRILPPEVRARKEQRLRHLETQAAIKGFDVQPEIANEIEDLQGELALADIVARPLDARITEAVKKFDPNELIARFVGEHARRLLAIEQWQQARDQGLKGDEERRIERQQELDKRLAKIDVSIRTLVIVFVFNAIVVIILLVVSLVR